MTPTQFSASQTALEAILPFHSPADISLSQFFRAHPKLGGQDRHIIAETVFAILRHLQSIRAYIPQKEESHARKVLLTWLALQQPLKAYQACLTPDEISFIKTLKAQAKPTLSLVQKAELPDWVVENLIAKNWEEDHILALGRSMQIAAPLDLRVNTLKAKREDVLQALQNEGISAKTTPYSPFGLRLSTKPALQRLNLFTEGKIEVQDEGSQLLGLLLAPSRHHMVIDFCAGAGGKTLLLGALMHSTGRLYALDIHQKRLNNLKTRLKRSGLSNVQAICIQHENDARIMRLKGKFDRVLVDAPCSGLGTLRRNPDLKFRQSKESLLELQTKQSSILQSAARLVKPEGRLVYATCSILSQENQEIVEAFLATHPEFSLQDAAEILHNQRIEIDLPSAPYFQLMPHIHQTDGFFAAVLTQTA